MPRSKPEPDALSEQAKALLRDDVGRFRYLNIRGEMARRRLSVTDFGNLVGMSQSLVSNYFGTNPRKRAGERITRSIETHLSLPAGRLDRDPNIMADANQEKDLQMACSMLKAIADPAKRSAVMELLTLISREDVPAEAIESMAKMIALTSGR